MPLSLEPSLPSVIHSRTDFNGQRAAYLKGDRERKHTHLDHDRTPTGSSLRSSVSKNSETEYQEVLYVSLPFEYD